MRLTYSYKQVSAEGFFRWLRPLALLLILAGPLWARQSAADVRDGYLRRDIRGFRVMLASDALKSPMLKRASVLLDKKLAELETVLPEDAVARVKTIPFWVRAARDEGAMVYHPSRTWLQEHGLNPDMARGVEISNMEHFVAWCSNEQPMMVLHELAHAYHDTVLGQSWPPLQAAYDHAVEGGLYQSVPYVLSRENKRAYALDNKSEYFAELSEAYFGKNDYFPYTRSDLATYDPVGLAMIERAWATAGQ